MITSKSERVVATGTSMLSKRSRMTDEQAASSGKNGRADLHMHSTYSDGSATIEQILARVEQHTDLDVIALTDHDVIEGALRARDIWQRGSYRFDFVVGEEVSTKEGHLLGLFLEKQIPKGLSMERSIDLIHEQGGLAVVAHPLHKFFRHSCKRETLDRIYASQDVWLDGIETWNASFCGIYANAVAMGTNREVYRLPELGNSDAHSLSAIGTGMTRFAGTTAGDVRAAIENGLTAPSGTMWDLQAYYQWVRYLSKRGKQAPAPTVVA
jgi:predicted metal-dependent phosphoesterase TrpH